MKRYLILFLLIMAVCVPAGAQAQKGDAEALLARQITADQGLFFALARDDIAALVTLRDQGADPNTSLTKLGLKVREVFGDSPVNTQPFDPRGWPILHWAVYLDNLEAAKVLLRSGARVNSPDIYGATALHWAAWGGRHSIAKLLLNNGASCQAADHKKRTPKDWAIMMGQNDMIRLLDSRTCKPAAIRDSDGDGVPDNLDECPNTPSGAQVDERGCWVVAYASFFDFDKAVVKPQYVRHVQDAAEVLKNHPDLLVDVEGHTDSVGSRDYNLGLGQRRAEAVSRILTDSGVPGSRLHLTSKGESKPLATNATAAGRARNRRVEIHVAQPGARGQQPAAQATSSSSQPAPDQAPADETRW